MEHVVDAACGAMRKCKVREVAFDEFDRRNVIEISTLAGDQAVGDADLVPATGERLREMRSDETCAAGDKVMGHIVRSAETGTPRRTAESAPDVQLPE